jgi:hypothetical protein
MSMPNKRANTVLAGLTFAAFLGGLLVSLIMFLGFGYGGFESVRFNSAAAATFVSTLALFVGMLGASSNLRVFTILALLGSSWLAFEVGYYDTSLLRYSTGTPGKAIACLVVLFVVESTAATFSALKLKQLRQNEVTPWQP